MKADDLREKYLNFFEKKGHKIIPSASLIPEHDPTVLFTTAGMHPLVPFLLGEEHPAGKRLVNIQKSFRTDDIDDVGDAWHNTFFEMLGNWSLGDYWKKETIEWSFEFLTKELGLYKEKIYVTVFGGDSEIPGVEPDIESIEIWKSVGIDDKKIYKLGKEDNWWGPVGSTGPCGPDTEMFYDTGKPAHGKNCHPGDTCGKYAEIWNDVFMQYYKNNDGKYESLKQKNVDTGMGIERTSAILQGKSNVYDTELFLPLIEKIRKLSKFQNTKSERIVADHLRAATFLLSDGVIPSNIERGYVLRRLIRRAIRHGRILGIEEKFVVDLSEFVITLYKNHYIDLEKNRDNITLQIKKEEDKFATTLHEGLKEFSKLTTINGKSAFRLYESYGFPIEITQELAKEKGLKVDKREFDEEFKKHQKISKAGQEKRFAGGLSDTSDKTIKGHTATHLLHQALRTVLGSKIHQTGSNITPERIRFDFSHSEKLTESQIKKVEDIVNQKIAENIRVEKKTMNKDEADKLGAIGLFKEKYGEKVSIYQIGDFSIEYCGGPHVHHTSEIGKFKITKEESLGSGQRRIRAILN